ncbi:MAG: sulfite exporter TauE/SafE family protein [Bacteroidota bacterium]|nr:sulfite exporter TauE/SafE family protein [Bacteroidota bacterium]
MFWTAITLGFLGSFHCVGMCGPIALALPLNRESLFSKVTGALLYNTGRVFMYALLGGLFGLIGQSIIIAGYQQSLSITLGITVLIMILLPNKLANKFRFLSFTYSFIGKVKQKLKTLFKQNSFSSLFFIGTLNALLPCGLVYLGIAGAIAAGSLLQGSIFMAVFGFGTVPAMLTVALISSSININFRKKINKAVPVFAASMALLLILRGMNLGIPYISPEMSVTKPECTKCCNK